MRKFFRSFHYAIEGIRFAMKERNMRIHVTCAVLVTIAGLYSQLSSAEWLVLILTMALVIALEMVNTAIETVVNLVSPEYHALAKAYQGCSGWCSPHLRNRKHFHWIDYFSA